MPIDTRPIPRFIADSSQEGIPYGRFAETLGDEFAKSVGAISDLPEGVEAPVKLDWFPERRWGGRVWIPVTARASGPEGDVELFGHVSYAQEAGTEPKDFRAMADFTDVLAEENPDWDIDLNDDVIGRWRGENDRAGDVTLVWGRPLLQGTAAASAQLEDQTVDQSPISDGRFTLIALDALKAYGDDVFLEVKVWNKRGQELASESLYAEDEHNEDVVSAKPDPA